MSSPTYRATLLMKDCLDAQESLEKSFIDSHFDVEHDLKLKQTCTTRNGITLFTRMRRMC